VFFFLVAVDGKMIAVKPVEPVLGGKPHPAIVVFQYGPDDIRREAVLGSNTGKVDGILLRNSRRGIECNRYQ